MKVNCMLYAERIDGFIQGGIAVLGDTNTHKGYYAEVYGYTVHNLETKTFMEIAEELRKNISMEEEEEVVNSYELDLHDFDENGTTIEEIKLDVSTAIKMSTSMSESLKRDIAGLLETKTPWRLLLSRFLMPYLKVSYSWKKQRRSSVMNDFTLPSQTTGDLVKGLFAIDTSGSIKERQLSMAISELISLVNTFRNVEIDVIIGDYELLGQLSIASGEKDILGKTKRAIRGGQGTSHRFVYQYMKQTAPSFCIMFTDGMSDIDSCEKHLPQNNVAKVFLVTGEYNKDIGKYGAVIETSS
jgi:predicted metal-dependent peptidase